MEAKLLHPAELDSRLSYPRGRSARLARKGLIPHLVLPDGEIRFDPEAIAAWLDLKTVDISVSGAAHA